MPTQLPRIAPMRRPLWVAGPLAASLVLMTACSDVAPTGPTPGADATATPIIVTEATRGTLTNGGANSASITAAGQTDTWTFSATQGNLLVVSIGEVSGSTNFTPWIRLVAPNATVLGNTWGAAAAQIQVNAPATGTYTVIVGTADASRVGTGTYRLSLIKSPGTFTLSTGDQGGAMTNGAIHNGSIVTGDVDPWTFSATQGNTIVVSIGELSGSSNFTPWIRLVSPTGAVLGSTWGAAAAQIQVAAPATGTYTVIVATADAGRSGTGSYQVMVVKAPGTLTKSTGDQGGGMSNGFTHTGTITVGDVDAWTFAATQGNTIVVGVGEITGSASFTPWIRLVSPTGTVLGNTWGASAAQIQVSAPATGTYTVIVGSADAGRSGTGTYRLILVKAPGAVVISAGDQGGPMTNGATHTGSIDVGGLDPWTFSATQGNTIVVSLGKVSGTTSFTPWLRLVSPTGAVVGSTWGASAAQLQLAAPTTGTYTVIVASADAGRSGTGSYRVMLVKAPGTFTVSTGDQGGALTTGVSRSGSIVTGDVDPWTFSASQGGKITVNVTKTSGTTTFTPWIRLVAPSGAIIGNTWGASGATITATAPSTGTFTVIVGTADAGRAGTGNYSLKRT